LAQEELDVGGRRGLRHRPRGHVADAESHEERRSLRDGAQTETSRGLTFIHHVGFSLLLEGQKNSDGL